MNPHDRLPSPPTSRGGIDRRRSIRLSRSLPLVLERDGSQVAVRTDTISEHGTLLTSPEAFTPGLTVSVVNPTRKTRLKGWVVWSRPGDAPGTFSIAVEFSEKADRFWGADYAP